MADIDALLKKNKNPDKTIPVEKKPFRRTGPTRPYHVNPPSQSVDNDKNKAIVERQESDSKAIVERQESDSKAIVERQDHIPYTNKSDSKAIVERQESDSKAIVERQESDSVLRPFSVEVSASERLACLSPLSSDILRFLHRSAIECGGEKTRQFSFGEMASNLRSTAGSVKYTVTKILASGLLLRGVGGRGPGARREYIIPRDIFAELNRQNASQSDSKAIVKAIGPRHSSSSYSLSYSEIFKEEQQHTDEVRSAKIEVPNEYFSLYWPFLRPNERVSSAALRRIASVSTPPPPAIVVQDFIFHFSAALADGYFKPKDGKPIGVPSDFAAGVFARNPDFSYEPYAARRWELGRILFARAASIQVKEGVLRLLKAAAWFSSLDPEAQSWHMPPHIGCSEGCSPGDREHLEALLGIKEREIDDYISSEENREFFGR